MKMISETPQKHLAYHEQLIGLNTKIVFYKNDMTRVMILTPK